MKKKQKVSQDMLLRNLMNHFGYSFSDGTLIANAIPRRVRAKQLPGTHANIRAAAEWLIPVINHDFYAAHVWKFSRSPLGPEREERR